MQKTLTVSGRRFRVRWLEGEMYIKRDGGIFKESHVIIDSRNWIVNVAFREPETAAARLDLARRAIAERIADEDAAGNSDWGRA